MPVTLKVILSDFVKEDGTSQVLLRATVNRQSRKPGLGIFIPAKDFNPNAKKKDWVRSRNEDHDLLNKQIKNIIKKVKKRIAHAQANETEITPSFLKETIEAIVSGKSHKEEKVSFTAFMQQEIQAYYPNQLSTYKLYNNLLTRLTEFKGTVYFSDLTQSFIEAFHTWLTTEYKSKTYKKPQSVNTANMYLLALHVFTEKAKKTFKNKNPLLRYEDDPFLNYQYKKESQIPTEILEPEEIALYEKADLKPGSKIFHARNVFLCQYYMAGTRISDILLLTWDKVDKFRASFTSLKTKTKHTIVLHDRLINLLALYERKEGFIFPYLDSKTDYSNPVFFKREMGRHQSGIYYQLKRLTKMLGITKNISSHVSRHTFTKDALLADNSLFNISQAIGHGSVKSTEGYTKRIKQVLSDRVINSVFGKDVAE